MDLKGIAASTVQPPSKRPGLHFPHRIPIAAVLPVVDHRPVGPAAERIHRERERASPIVERVEDERDQIVPLPAVGAVSPHLSRDQPVHLTVPYPERDIHVLVVERDPRLCPFGRGLPAFRLDLDELGDGRDIAIERLVEGAVDSYWLIDTYGSHGRASFFVTPDDLRCHRRRRCVRVKDGVIREAGALECGWRIRC